MIEKFAKCIEILEGYFEGTRAFRNRNPGNLRYARQRNAVGKDKDGFAIFSSYDDGFNALCSQLWRACKGQSKIYSPEDTLYDFFSKYAPASDGNKPKEYAERVALKLKVSADIKIKELL